MPRRRYRLHVAVSSRLLLFGCMHVDMLRCVISTDSCVSALQPQSTMAPEAQGGGSDGDGGGGGLSGALVFAIAAGVLLVLTSAMAYVAMKRRSERRTRRQAEQLARMQSSMLSVTSSMGSIDSFY